MNWKLPEHVFLVFANLWHFSMFPSAFVLRLRILACLLFNSDTFPSSQVSPMVSHGWWLSLTSDVVATGRVNPNLELWNPIWSVTVPSNYMSLAEYTYLWDTFCYENKLTIHRLNVIEYGDYLKNRSKGSLLERWEELHAHGRFS